MESSLQVRHADTLSLPKLCLVLCCIVELVLVLGHLFINQDNVLAYLVGLPRLNAWDQQQWHNIPQLLPWQDRADHSLGHQLIQVDIQLGFLLWMQAGWLCPDEHCVSEVQMAVVFWVPDPPNVHLDSCQLIFTWQQVAQEGTPCSFTNCFPKLALRM